MRPDEHRYRTVGQQLSGVRLSPWDGAAWAAGRYLGRFAPDELLEELELFGVLAGIHARGYERLELELDDGGCPGRSVVRLWRADVAAGARRAPAALLMELVMWREGLEVVDPELAPPLAAAGRMPVVTCEYLLLQDPDRPFDPQRPRMPGQRFVGLGLGDQVLAAMVSWTARLGGEGLLTLPDYFHSAVIFDRGFHAFDPELEGLLDAARRDLEVARRGLAAVSWCFEWGLVGLERLGATSELRRPWLWPSEAELVPVGALARAWMASEAYAERRAAARAGHRFVLDEEEAARRWPSTLPRGHRDSAVS